MAKKKYRDIVVDGVKYAWMVRGYYDGSTLKVWKDKKVLFVLDVDYDLFKDIYGTKVKPSLVAKKIKEYEAKH